MCHVVIGFDRREMIGVGLDVDRTPQMIFHSAVQDCGGFESSAWNSNFRSFIFFF